MKCTVYKLREQGIKLKPEVIRARGVVGDLVVTEKGPWGQPVQGALLRDDSGQTILQLACVKVKQIERDGILIAGRESVIAVSHSAPSWHQAWWCVVDRY